MQEPKIVSSLLEHAGLDEHSIGKVARDTGFCRRRARKIKPFEFLSSLLALVVRGITSYGDLAQAHSCNGGRNATRQSFAERISAKACLLFMQTILARILLWKAGGKAPLPPRLRFSRILLQDSTIVQLPLRLLSAFSGVKNATSSSCNARIQCVYDLLSGTFLHFSINSYSKNDISSTDEIGAKKGDLVLRDRGYFKVDDFEKMRKNGITVITRFKHKTSLFFPNSLAPIDLLRFLRKNGRADMTVFTGEKKDIQLRLVAIPVPDEVAEQRRRKARQETKGRNPSAELLALMNWSIFLLSPDQEDLTPEDIAKIYALRWRIETIFKSWKSMLSFDKIHNVGENQLQVILLARLCHTCLIQNFLFLPLSKEIRQHCKRHLSLFKFLRYVLLRPPLLLEFLLEGSLPSHALDAIARLCSIEKRKRQNFQHSIELVFNELILLS